MLSLVVLAVPIGLLPACERKAAEEPYIPGLGEIMTLQQMRHGKLWLAGDAGNWPLAAYEIDELGEGFDDAAHFHAAHKDSPVPIDVAIRKIMEGPLKDIRAVVDAKDGARFAGAFDQLTEACNACHRATNFSFNVVTRPTANPYPNQVFPPPAER